jgi:hypothetical protein
VRFSHIGRTVFSLLQVKPKLVLPHICPRRPSCASLAAAVLKVEWSIVVPSRSVWLTSRITHKAGVFFGGLFLACIPWEGATMEE